MVNTEQPVSFSAKRGFQCAEVQVSDKQPVSALSSSVICVVKFWKRCNLP